MPPAFAGGAVSVSAGVAIDPAAGCVCSGGAKRELPHRLRTFVALKAYVDNWRSKGVPFYLRTGKRLPTRHSEIFIQFNEVPHSIFAGRGAVVQPNKLIIRLQPEEHISLLMMAKQPGLDRDAIRLREVPLDIGMANAFVDTRRRIEHGLLHADILTVAGESLTDYASDLVMRDGTLEWKQAVPEPLDATMLRPASDPFQPDGGMRLVQGNLGRGTFKTSAVEPSRWTIEAPARIFSDQDEVLAAFKAGELDRDVVVVVRFQGPRANGMPELHKLTPSLGVLQDRGHRVALVTDGRMSGASGKVPAAIHVTPEALGGGPLARLRDGDLIRLCAETGELSALVTDLEAREPALPPPAPLGTGRELFAMMRHGADGAEQGASAMLAAMEQAA